MFRNYLNLTIQLNYLVSKLLFMEHMEQRVSLVQSYTYLVPVNSSLPIYWDHILVSAVPHCPSIPPSIFLSHVFCITTLSTHIS